MNSFLELKSLNFKVKGLELPQRLIDMGVISIDGSKPLLRAVRTIDGELLTEEQWCAVDEWLSVVRDESN